MRACNDGIMRALSYGMTHSEITQHLQDLATSCVDDYMRLYGCDPSYAYLPTLVCEYRAAVEADPELHGNYERFVGFFNRQLEDRQVCGGRGCLDEGWRTALCPACGGDTILGAEPSDGDEVML